MDRTVREGGCGCGAVRFRAFGDPIYVNNCHCRLCQQQTGSTSVVNANFESERVALIQGELTDHVVVTGSGGRQVIRRCAACGVAVWSHYPRLGQLTAAVRVGAFDDPGALPPDAVIFASSRMPWVALPDDVPVFEMTYDPSQVLSPARFARLQALLDRRKAGEGD